MLFNTKTFLLVFVYVLMQPHTMCSQQAVRGTSAVMRESARDNVMATATKMNKKETKRLFGRNLLSYGIQPIAITLYNDSDDALLLRATSFNIALERAQTVVETVQIPTLLYTVVPACYAGLYFWPALIPIVGAGYWMSSRNQFMNSKVQAEILEGDIALEILPYEQLNKIIFVRDTALVDDEISFHVFNLHQKSFIPFTLSL